MMEKNISNYYGGSYHENQWNFVQSKKEPVKESVEDTVEAVINNCGLVVRK